MRFKSFLKANALRLAKSPLELCLSGLSPLAVWALCAGLGNLDAFASALAAAFTAACALCVSTAWNYGSFVEQGHMDRFLLSPLTPAEIFLGIVLPHILLYELSLSACFLFFRPSLGMGRVVLFLLCSPIVFASLGLSLWRLQGKALTSLTTASACVAVLCVPLWVPPASILKETLMLASPAACALGILSQHDAFLALPFWSVLLAALSNVAMIRIKT